MSITDWITSFGGVVLAVGLLYYRYKAGKLADKNQFLETTGTLYKKSAAYYSKANRELENVRDKQAAKRIKQVADQGTRLIAAGDVAGVAEFMRRGVEASRSDAADELPGASVPGSSGGKALPLHKP
jgi:hypothetical protein